MSCLYRFTVVAALVVLPLSADIGDFYADHQLVLDVCTRCHGLDYYITPRSHKSWELTVANMRSYVWDEADGYTEEQGKRIARYLGNYFGEDSELDPIEFFGSDSAYPDQTTIPEPGTETNVAGSTTDATPDENAVSTAAPEAAPTAPEESADGGETGVTPAQTAAVPAEPSTGETTATGEEASEPVAEAASPVASPPSIPIRPDMPESVRRRLETPPWRPGPGMLRCAEFCGYAAVLFLLGLIVTGHNRRRLKKRFRKVHACLALGLFLSLAGHGLIYLARYGGPPVAWYWFGVASFLVLVAAQVQGIVRKRFGRAFLRLHVCAGYVGLVAAILHWVWAWL